MTRTLVSPSSDGEAFVELGVFGRPHGVDGELRLTLHNPDSSLVFELDALYVHKDGCRHRVPLAGVRPGPKPGVVLVRLTHIADRELAAALTGCPVSVPRDALPPLQPDEFYVADLEGCAVFDGDRPVGTVAYCRRQADIEILHVETGDWEIQIPLVPAYVAAVDVSARRVLVRDVDDLPRNPL